MGEVIELQGQLEQLTDNQEFISDLCRFAENLMTEKQVRKKYRLAESAWEALGSNDSLVEKIEAEKLRRIRDGSSKREKAQLHVLGAPDVLNALMTDVTQSARHRIDSAVQLDRLAANGPQGAPAADRFSIVINLGSDTLKFDKSIAVDPNDVDPYNIDTGAIAAIAAKKPTEGGSGGPV